MSKIHHDVLAAAAQDALQAPSVLNTQPWRWRIDADVLELHADRDRQLAVADPDGRLLLLSCGAALHHARLAMAAAGWSAQVRRLADSSPMIFWRASSWAHHRGELVRGANRPSWSGGVPAGTTVRRVPRRVPVRELTLPLREGMQVQPGGDRGATYFVLFGDSDDAPDWLRAGEALSAVLLTAIALGLSVTPISDVIEVAHPRELVRGLLTGRGHPFIVLRRGLGAPTEDLATVPRRDPAEVIRERSDRQ